jgi:hypothetical protein
MPKLKWTNEILETSPRSLLNVGEEASTREITFVRLISGLMPIRDNSQYSPS